MTAVEETYLPMREWFLQARNERMGKLERNMAREQGRLTAKEGSRLFREALKVGEQVEAGLKAATNKMPFWHRLLIAFRIIRKVWR